MLSRTLRFLVVGCAAMLIGCADDDTATNLAPEPPEQQAAVQVEQQQERSTERREAAPTSVTKASTPRETQSNETPATTESAASELSEPSEQPKTKSADPAATQSASSNLPPETEEQNADHEPSVAQSEPAASVSQAQPQSQAQSREGQEGVAEPETQSEPEQEPPAADNEPQAAAEQSHVAQAPATDPEEEQATPRQRRPDTSGFVTTQQDGDSGGDVGGEETTDPLQGSETDQSTDEPPIEGPSYTWQDGEHTRTIIHVTALTVETRVDGRNDIVERQESSTQSDESPVFRSDTGELMMLPGGVLVILDATWDQVRINQLFADNGIALSRVQPHSFAPNGFFIETELGFASLNLANLLAAQEGVVLSSPNWERRVVTQ